MPDTYDKFKEQFAAVNTQVDAHDEKISAHVRFLGQKAGVIQEGVKEMGLRIQHLKDAGNAGTSIDDFMKDPEIIQMKASINGYLGKIKTELTTMATAETEMKKTVTAFQNLKLAVTTEIAKRKKEASSKLGTGNKSLPDMEKLLAAMKKYTDEKPYIVVEGFEAETYADHERETNDAIADQVTQTKAAAHSTFEDQMMEQMLNVRVLKGNLNRAVTAYKEVMAQCEVASKALTAMNKNAFETAKTNIKDPWNLLNNMNATYQKAIADTWIKARLAESKDKGTVTEYVKKILDMRTAAGAEISKIATTRL